MPEDRQLPPNLLSIKSHFDSHGYGSAIVEDHVAIGVCEKCGADGGERQAIRRVKSFDESRQIIGCQCDCSE